VPWRVLVAESVLGDLQWFGRKTARTLLTTTIERLSSDPKAETTNMKTLRPNPYASRELRLFGKYRVLFNVSDAARSRC
jgi:hypothetical protein